MTNCSICNGPLYDGITKEGYSIRVCDNCKREEDKRNNKQVLQCKHCGEDNELPIPTPGVPPIVNCMFCPGYFEWIGGRWVYGGMKKGEKMATVEPDKENILEEAVKITSTDRREMYGPPEEDYRRVAKIANILTGKKLTAADCAKVMIAVKLSREVNKHKRDNLVDLAGYAWVLSRIEGDEGASESGE